jgi:general secretion pathway protein G
MRTNQYSRNRKRRETAGVTLIEMLVVMTIIALFAALVVPNMLKHGERARIVKAHSDIQAFMTALNTYKLDTGVFPTTEQGLRALREKPADMTQWAGPYIQQEVAKDPWDHDYVYHYPGEHDTSEPEVVCYGADGQPGGEGINADIVSWKSN